MAVKYQKGSSKADLKEREPVYNEEGDEIEMIADQVDVARRGTQIVLPPEMSYDEGIVWLKRKRADEEAKVGIYHVLDVFPLDGAYAFKKAIDQIYGWSATVNSFWEQTTMVSLQIGPNESVQVPWGPIKIPGIEGELSTGLDPRSPVPRFLVQGQVKKKHEDQILKLYNLTKEIIAKESIYRGKAIRVDFSYAREKRAFHFLNDQPKFMETGDVNPNDLVFEATTDRIINMTLFALIERAPTMRKYKIPLKKGVLLAGKYGTGKTMTANVTAKKGTDNGFTFIYLRDVRDLVHGLRLAAQYSPAILFAEDIDRAMSGERDSGMDEILNTLDGVDTKTAEILTVLTTNHIEKVNAAMLRPGRLDAIVPINEPDAAAAAKLIQIYGRGLLATDFDYAVAGAALAGNIPAIIRECVERAKVAAIHRCDGEIEGKVIAQDVLTAVDALKAQIELIKPSNIDNRHPIERFAATLGEEIGKPMRQLIGMNNGDEH